MSVRVNWKEEDARRVMAEIVRVIVRPGEIWEGSGKALILFANEAQKEVLAKEKWRNLATYATLSQVSEAFTDLAKTPGISIKTLKAYRYVPDPNFIAPQPSVPQEPAPVPVPPVVEKKLLQQLLEEVVELLVESPSFRRVLEEVINSKLPNAGSVAKPGISAANNTGTGLMASSSAAEIKSKTVLVIYGGRSIKDSLLRAFHGRKDVKLLPWFCEDNTNNLKAKLSAGNFDHVVYQTSVANHSIDAIIKSNLGDKRKLRMVSGNHMKITEAIEECLKS